MGSVITTISSPETNTAPASPAAEYRSWGRYPTAHHREVHKVYWSDQVLPILSKSGQGDCLPYGLGRSYGDSCLNSERALVDCSRLNRILAFDRHAGIIQCEAGTSLSEILEIAVPAGWFLPVTPGTKHVTVGGAIANDVHGKNHHRAGTFGAYVRRIVLARSDAGILECDINSNNGLFEATLGGLGLTGIILGAEISLKPISTSLILAESLQFSSMAEFLALCEESDQDFEYTVASVDGLSVKSLRGIFLRGNHDTAQENATTYKRVRGLSLPVPSFVMNRFTAAAFNRFYYRRRKAKNWRASVHLDSFFYPLDRVRHWNRLYGASGFLQYQCVVPESSCDVFQDLVIQIAKQRSGPFLSVWKRFGSIPSPGVLSFPRPGITFALDFPFEGEHTLQILDRLDAVVKEAGGALYPAKDARMSPQMFQSSFPKWLEFSRFVDPALSSSFWRRVTEN